jgi:2-polyprenyl-6-methoxyphenol hydroxylase-like FAD-dependent oxidoreductase
VRTIVIGGGLIGSLCAIALARQGFTVEVIDRDPGPSGSQEWKRRGVMQFHQPHGFRKFFHQFLLENAPDVWDSLLDAGCIPAPMPDQVAGPVPLQSRRETVERVLRERLAKEPGVTLIVGHADSIESDAGSVKGVLVNGALHESDVVVVAAGRESHLGDAFRPPGEFARCGLSYVSRSYAALPGNAVPVSAWPFAARGDGYFTAMFPQDDDQFSLLVIRPVHDEAFARLRDGTVFDRFARAVPNLAPWCDPERFVPLSAPIPGPELSNSYRGQAVIDGEVTCAGLFFIGDTVMATNPSMGRGAATGVLQVAELLAILADKDLTLGDAVLRLDAFDAEQMHPWFEDHLETDANFLRAVTGQDIDTESSINSALVVEAMEELPEIQPAAFAYMDMDVMPSSLDPFRERVRSALRSGWRPAGHEGPSRQELEALLAF